MSSHWRAVPARRDRLARSLSSWFCLSARAVPFDPGEFDGCIYPLLHRRRTRLCGSGFIQSDGLATLNGVTRLIRFACATAHAFAFRGFARRITPVTRPVRYMANGSFHGELLSVHKTKTVSLTHRSRGDTEERDFNPRINTNSHESIRISIRVDSCAFVDEFLRVSVTCSSSNGFGRTGIPACHGWTFLSSRSAQTERF